MKKVLVLEDESNIRSFVVLNLNRAGYETVEAGSGEEALELLKQHPDIRLALLDVMLPGMDGFEVCHRIRASNSKVGIIMLTARTQEMDKVTGLMTGADDYVTKPFSPADLTARVDALSREDILAAVWGRDYDGELKIVDVNIRRLRIKIENDPTEPEYLTTVWGYGYKWGY